MARRSYHDTSWGPNKSRLKDTLGGEVLETCASVSFLSRTMRYKVVYCLWIQVLPNKQIYEPLQLRRIQSGIGVSLWPLDLYKNVSPQVSSMRGTRLLCLDTYCARYFQTPSSARSLYRHLPIRALFFTWI